jgi:hypothetical protein
VTPATEGILNIVGIDGGGCDAVLSSVADRVLHPFGGLPYTVVGASIRGVRQQTYGKHFRLIAVNRAF